jgi:hypothetical protein
MEKEFMNHSRGQGRRDRRGVPDNQIKPQSQRLGQAQLARQEARFASLPPFFPHEKSPTATD